MKMYSDDDERIITPPVKLNFNKKNFSYFLNKKNTENLKNMKNSQVE